MCYTGPVEGRTLRWLVVVAGAAWGFGAYLALWGYTPIVVTERYVDSLPGLLLLLPARLVLETIHLVEQRIVHHPFDFSANNAWIGYAAAAVGAATLMLARAIVTAPARLLARGRPEEPAQAEGPPSTHVAP
jgi:hypothetical protein